MNRVRHIVLKSNGSDDAFPDNTPADFTTQLPLPLVQEDGEYEIALTQFQFVRALPTISDTGMLITSARGRARLPIVLPDPDVSSIPELVKGLNAAMPRNSGVSFRYSPYTLKTTISLTAGSITLSRELASILGFQHRKTEYVVQRPPVVVQTSESKYVSDLYRGVYHLYIYSDVSEKIPVGSNMESLLGIVSISKGVRSAPEVESKTFMDPMYVKLLDNRVASIRIYVTDDGKNPVHFRLGPSIARLSLRRVAQSSS